jgi:phosphoribosyl 1,2-cyclic phosphodiesterase
VRYGGNTSCVEVRSSRGTCVVLDCGTGARPLGTHIVESAHGEPTTGALLLGHTHWDHIQGLPFFAPLYGPGQWDVYGPRGMNESLRQTLAAQMRYPYFPVTIDQLEGGINYHELVEGVFDIDDVVVRTQYLNHPALTLAYRLECDGSAVCYVADHEPFDPALGAGGDVRSNRDDDRHVAFLEGADVVIHDAQYTPEEYAGRVGWGHSTIEYAVDVCCAAGAAQTVLFHHDPSHDDDTVDRLLIEAQRRAGARTTVSAAREGSAVQVSGTGHGAAPSAARRATTRPALDSLCANTLILTSDVHLRFVVTEAASAERLAVFDSADVPAVDPDRVLVVADVDDGGLALDDALSQLSTRAHEDVGVLAVSRHIGATVVTPVINEWLVWPASVAHVRTKLRAAILRRACRWMSAPLPPDEPERLAALRSLGLLDTPPDERFDRYTRRACERFGVPLALMTLVDRDRQWFKSRVGIEFTESPRDQSFCAHAILGPDVMQVPDTTLDPRFADSPVVTGPPRVRFYAGAPLHFDGHRVGTLCIADQRPRLLDAADLRELCDLASLVVAVLNDSA